MKSLVFFLLTCLSVVHAADNYDPADIFSANIPVKTRSSADFKQATEAGLVEVVAKSAGKSLDEVRGLTSLATDFSRADQWVSRYGYLTEQQPEGKRLILHMSFPEDHVKRLLSLGKLPYLPMDRPNPLILIVRMVDGRPQFVNDTPEVRGLMSDLLMRHGIRQAEREPYILKKLNAYKVWALHTPDIAARANLDDGQPVFVIKLKDREFNTLEVDWLLIQNADERSGSIMSGTLQDGLDSAFVWLVGQWSARYAVDLKNESNELELTILHIRDYSEYMEVLKYLERQAVVRSAFLSSSSADSVQIAVSLTTAPDRFVQLLRADGKLMAVETGDVSGLSFNWQP